MREAVPTLSIGVVWAALLLGGLVVTAPELALLRAAVERCSTVVLALTKTDLHPRWREVRDLDLGHLRAHGLARVPVLPVSATLAAYARRLAEARTALASG